MGCGDDEPEPVVLGGVTVREAVVLGGEPLFAVLLLLFQPRSAAAARHRQPNFQPKFSSRPLVHSSRR
ncbi:MAG: hypothetical protein WCD65_03405, partial [Pseudolabrys sp.]